jgi:hypothetical protein
MTSACIDEPSGQVREYSASDMNLTDHSYHRY